MKIFVINGNNSGGRHELEIDEYSQGENIKFYLDELLQQDQTWTKDYYRLIYKNIIINDHDFINRYKIFDGEEIWYGRVEEYLSRDSAIVEVFLTGWVPDWSWLVVKETDTIAAIRSTIATFRSEILHILNTKGIEMMDDQVVKEIDADGYYRVIVKCDDEHVQHLAFDDYCDQYDRLIIKFYVLQFSMSINVACESKIITDMKNKTNKIRQIISSDHNIYGKLNTNLSDFPNCYRNSKFMFCNHICERIWLEVCEEYWHLIEDPENSWEWAKLRSQFRLSLLDSLRKYSLVRSDHSENVHKSYNAIVLDALNCFMQLLTVSDDDFKCSIKL